VDGERELVSTNSFVWTPSTANAYYRVEVWLRSAGSGDRFNLLKRMFVPTPGTLVSDLPFFLLMAGLAAS
jgi:hypothetical protein